MKEEVRIVTAFIDIGRSDWVGEKNGEELPSYLQRNTDLYFERFERLCKLNNKIAVFSTQNYKERLESLSPNVEFFDVNDILANDSSKLIKQHISNIQKNQTFINFVDRKYAPEYWSPEYVMINFFKPFFVDFYAQAKELIEETLAWIDFGYCREDNDAPSGKTFMFDDNDRVNIFSNGKFNNHHTILELIKTGDVLIQGSHIIAPAYLWGDLCQEMELSLESLCEVGLIDDDQTMLLMSYRRNEDFFELNINSSSDWFNVIRNNCA